MCNNSINATKENYFFLGKEKSGQRLNVIINI